MMPNLCTWSRSSLLIVQVSFNCLTELMNNRSMFIVRSGRQPGTSTQASGATLALGVWATLTSASSLTALTPFQIDQRTFTVDQVFELYSPQNLLYNIYVVLMYEWARFLKERFLLKLLRGTF